MNSSVGCLCGRRLGACDCGAAARTLYTCATPGCEAAGQGFTDEPTFCSLCLNDLAGVYDMTGTLKTEEELRA